MIKRILVSIIFIILIGILLVWVWLSEPYLRKEYTRLPELEEINTVYAGWLCGSDSPQLTPYVIESDGHLNYTGESFLLSLAEGVPNPENSEAGIAGNQFTLWAYREKLIKTNIFTNQKTEIAVSRLYVVGWSTKSLYYIYDSDGEVIERNKPLKYISLINKHATLNFIKLKQIPC